MKERYWTYFPNARSYSSAHAQPLHPQDTHFAFDAHSHILNWRIKISPSYAIFHRIRGWNVFQLYLAIMFACINIFWETHFLPRVAKQELKWALRICAQEHKVNVIVIIIIKITISSIVIGLRNSYFPQFTSLLSDSSTNQSNSVVV